MLCDLAIVDSATVQGEQIFSFVLFPSCLYGHQASCGPRPVPATIAHAHVSACSLDALCQPQHRQGKRTAACSLSGALSPSSGGTATAAPAPGAESAHGHINHCPGGGQRGAQTARVEDSRHRPDVSYTPGHTLIHKIVSELSLSTRWRYKLDEVTLNTEHHKQMFLHLLIHLTCLLTRF